MSACPFSGAKLPPRKMMSAMCLDQTDRTATLKAGVAVPSPKENQVLIKILTIGLNPVESYYFLQQKSIHECEFGDCSLTPGSSCAGIVEQLGCKVTKFKVGHRVYTSKTLTGTYAEYTVADVQCTFHLHDNLNFSQGAVLGVPYFMAYKALIMKAQAKAGNVFAVNGASREFEAAFHQLATSRGIAIKRFKSKKNESDVKCAVCNDHLEKSCPDIIIEMEGATNLSDDIECVKRKGCIVIMENSGDVHFNPLSMMKKECRIEAVSSISENEIGEISSAMWAGQEMGWVKPVISREYPLSEAVQAHTFLGQPNRHGAVILSTM